MVSRYAAGDLVWVQASFRPGKIVLPSSTGIDVLEPLQYVYFFGSRECEWLKEWQLTPHSEEMLQQAENLTEDPILQAALEELKREIARPVDEPFESMPLGEPSCSRANTVPKKIRKRKKKRKISNLKQNGGKKIAQASNCEQAVIDNTASTSGDNSNRSDSKKLDLATYLNRCKPLISLLEPSNSAACSDNFQINAYTLSINAGISTSSIEQGLCEKSASLSLGNSADDDSNTSAVEKPPESSCDNSSVQSENSGEPSSLMDGYVQATKKQIGFLGLGKMGSSLVQKLMNTGHLITVWNRSPEKCQVFLDNGAEKAEFPSEVINRCDITFCLLDENAVKEVFEGTNGILEGFKECKDNKKGKGLVQMTPLDPLITAEMSESISVVGGKYLEAAMLMSREVALQLSTVICAGDQDLFNDCKTCFVSITKNVYFLGTVPGKAIELKVGFSMVIGVRQAAMRETVSLASRKNLPLAPLMNFLTHTGFLSCPETNDKATALLNNQTETLSAIESYQRDFKGAALLAGRRGINLPIAASVNQFYESAKQRADENNECKEKHED